jgi:MFS family permease
MNLSASPGNNPVDTLEMQPASPTHRKSILSVIALLTTMGLLVLGYGLQGTLIGLRARYDHIPLEHIGLMMSAFFIGFGSGSLLAPRFVFSVGHVRTFAALASISSAAALGYLLLGGSLNWFILRVIQGGCYGGMVVVVESWLNGSTPDTHRGRILSVYQILISCCWAGSQFLIGLAPVTGFTLFCLVSMLLSLSLVPITLSKVESPFLPEPSPAKLNFLAMISPIGVAGAFV